MAIRTTILVVAALAVVIAAAFHPIWLQGHGLMAAYGAPGVTRHGPAQLDEATPVGADVPTTDAVAANIDEPLAFVAHRQMAAGELPLWNPHNGLGVPLLGNWQSAVWNPLRALVQAFPDAPFAFDATYLLRLWVAAVGAFLLARRLGVAPLAAAAAGVTFGLTGYFVRYLQMHHLNGEVFLPWLWLAADALARHPTPRAWLGFAAVTFCAIVAGNPQVTFVIAVATVAFALWRTATGAWPRHDAPRIAGRLALAAVPPLLLSSAYWLAGLEYVANSVHHHDAKFGADAYTLAGALGFLVPEPFAMPAAKHVVAPYFGLVPLFVAALGIGVGLGRSVFLWALFVVTAGKIAGVPGIAWLGELPGFAVTKNFKYLYPVAALALALLCAGGVDALVRRRVNARHVAIALTVVVVVTLPLVGAGLHVASAEEWIDFAATLPLALRLAFVAAITWAILRPHPRLPAAAVAAAAIALELVVSTPGAWMPRHEPFARPPFVDFLKTRDPRGTRTFGVLGMLTPNQNAVFGIDDVRLHDGVFPARFGPFVRRFLDPNVRRWPVFTADDLGTLPAEQLRAGQRVAARLLHQAIALDVEPSTLVQFHERKPSRYLDLLNVRWLILPNVEWMQILARQWSKAEHEVVHEDRDALVVERKRALPRAFFPATVESVDGLDTALERMDRDDYDPKAVAYVEAPLEATGAGPFVGTAVVKARPRADTLVLSAQASTPAWLVASIYPYPGLRAEIDGKPAEVVPANGMLSAIRTPRGRFEVRFVYEPTYGTKATWLALLGAGVLLFVTLRAVRATARTDD